MLAMEERDRTARARIRDAAVAVIADRGVRAATIRAIADAAAVSPALVIHHFGSKQGVVDAASAAVLDRLSSATREEDQGADPAGGVEQRLVRLERLLDAHPEIGGFVRRMLVDASPEGLAWFRAAVDGSVSEMQHRERVGMARPSADVRAEAAMLLILGMAPVLLGSLLEHALDVDFADEAARARWRRAQAELLTSPLYPAAVTRSRSRRRR